MTSAMINHLISVFLGFFAIMNPIANTAIFIGLCGSKKKKTQKSIASKALLLSFIIVVLFALLGKTIFHLFGITLPALRITGGILIFIIGYQMLHGESSKLHQTDSGDADIAVSPLAVPILAGPGTIATAMNFSAAGSWMDILVTMVVFAFLCVLTYAFFMSGEKMVKALGDSGIAIITRLMGLILAVIGTEMLLQGVKESFSVFL